MITRLQLTVTLLLAALVLAVMLRFQGVPIDLTWFKYAFSAVGPVLGLMLVFEYLLWKWLPTIIVRRPHLAGTWRGVLRSTWKDESGATKPEIECFVVVSQTYSTISVRLYTVESQSKSITSRILSDDGVYVLESTYLNEPKLPKQDKSHMHYGAMRLNVARAKQPTLTGVYWTQRGSVGELSLVDHNDDIVDGFEAGKKLFAAP